MSKQLDKLKATMQRIEAQKAELDQKIKAQARKDRNHSIYQRGGELTMHLGDKAEVFTDEDIKLFLNHVFSFSGIQKLLTQMREIRSGESRFTMVRERPDHTADRPAGHPDGGTVFGNKLIPQLVEGALMCSFGTQCALRGPLRGARCQSAQPLWHHRGKAPALTAVSYPFYSARH